MNLTTVLLVCAIAAGLLGGISARYRRWGTDLTDIITAFLVAGLFTTVEVVVLVLVAGLDFFGIIHVLYLAIVVAFPVGVAWIMIPNLLDAERRTPFLGWLLLLGAGACVVVGLWATHVEPFRLQVDQQVLGATGSTQPLVVGVIADLQTTSIGSHEDAALDAVLAGNPDLVVIPGDLFQLDEFAFAEVSGEFLGWLRRLRAEVDHVVIVHGNTDLPEIVEELAEASGVIYLADDLVALDINGQDVTVVGMAVVEGREPGDTEPLLIETLAETTTQADLVIAVSHYPDVVLTLERDSTIDLIVAGHTHGGQVSIPGVGPPITFSDVPVEVAAGGLHVVNGHPIYVSTGVGLERGQAPQLRFGVPPSVALLTIVPATN